MALFKSRTKSEYDKLIKLCVKGDRIAQKELYNLFSGKMLSICSRYTNTRAEAEDVLQDGFVKIFKNLYRFRHDGSFEGWIRRIFVNTAIEHYRRHHHMYAINEVTFDAKNHLRNNGLDNLEANDVHKLIQELSPGYRNVFNMYVIDGLSHKEIAEKLGVTEGTSKSQLARARYILQQRIKEQNATFDFQYGEAIG